jgi:hypothetical protein
MMDEKLSVVSCQLFNSIFSNLCNCHMQWTTDYGQRAVFSYLTGDSRERVEQR